jgi:hypothetical protein
MPAGDKSGIHAFFNERQEPVRRLLAEQQRQGQIKVSNGRPWRPMWVVLHTASCLELRFWEEGLSRVLRLADSRAVMATRSGSFVGILTWARRCVQARIAFMSAYMLAASFRLGMPIQRADA